VTVFPRPEVLDPQGKTIHQAAQRIGFDSVTEVRAGKCFEVELAVNDEAAARELLDALCEKLLANTVVEDYAFELLPSSEGTTP
jgi:phosphoribosylformylglycinamidine synthase